MSVNLKAEELFEHRHNGEWDRSIGQMLSAIGVKDIDELIDQTVPANIRDDQPLSLPDPVSESGFIKALEKKAGENRLFTSLIGMGYYGTVTPAVIRRNILENPGWYTAYTPYQAEVAQGRLEALINFQTMVSDLTGLEIANASLLDEGTAAAEAMSMFYALRKGDKKQADKFFVDRAVFPQTLDVLKTRSVPRGIRLIVDDPRSFDFSRDDLFGALFQYPGEDGRISDPSTWIGSAHDHDVKVAVAADLLSLAVLKSPGEMGADVAVGSTQRFGVPMGYGGPHAAYFATLDPYKRHIPGRIIGVSLDRDGKPAYRMALQTREQHIRREKATSNICTAQVLLAVMAGMYAVYHGPEGLRRIASKVHGLAVALDRALQGLGYKQRNEWYFDTLRVETGRRELTEKIRKFALAEELNFRYFQNGDIGLSLDETHDLALVEQVAGIFRKAKDGDGTAMVPGEVEMRLPAELERKTAYLEHPVFNSYHSEHEMVRYLKRLENKDISLVHSMISLGSCTMKLNATTEMIPVTWREWADIHPFVPEDQVKGYKGLIKDLGEWLTGITGLAATTLQPNSGAQGEFTGLMIIRAYHESRGESHRNVALIPSSAHGTNPASAVMAGMEVVIVRCDDGGNIDLQDLKEKAEQHRERLAAFMVTYPSTHGVFEEDIVEMCKVIHENGGQVYMDGANMNAQVGLTSPAKIGADVCHLNLHKTFAIPHGGGGPGVGPVCVAGHLVEFLPGNPVVKTGGKKAITAVSSAPYGSAGILVISYAYIAMMGAGGLTKATKKAILNANYLKERLSGHFKILYAGKNGRCAHEMIVDCRMFKSAGIEVEDIAKRLMDYGFHAPTVSFPVPGTLMIEPTESESLEELDRFVEAMAAIREEIREVEEGRADKLNNVLKNAPHTAAAATSDQWDYPYSREKAVYPLEYVRDNKFWPSVRRIDNAYGDRHLVCSCLPLEAYETIPAK